MTCAVVEQLGRIVHEELADPLWLVSQHTDDLITVELRSSVPIVHVVPLDGQIDCQQFGMHSGEAFLRTMTRVASVLREARLSILSCSFATR